MSDTPHHLRRDLRLPDLVSMQVLLVFGASWVGTAARLGSTHLFFWIAAIAAFFIPQAMVVAYCAGIWPQEGGVYQWTRHAIGPFAGFISAWNFGAYAILIVAALGIQIAASLHYAFGPSAAWMETSRPFVTGLNAALMLAILLINVAGFRYGKWVAHFGTAVTLLVVALAVFLLFIHPEATATHPHVTPQPPFALALPAFSLLSLNIFSKLAFYGLSGLEQVAVFAGEMRNPRRNIARSALTAAPLVALLYIAATGALLSYTPAAKIDLSAPIPQLLGAALTTGALTHTLLAVVNLAFAAFLLAQFATIVAEASRLPMVAAWDHLIPQAFTRLHPKFRTPTLAIATVTGCAFIFSLIASYGAGTDEAFQIMVSAANMAFGLYYTLMFAVPLLAGTSLSRRPDLTPGWPLRLACLSGLAVTLLSLAYNLIPIVKVASPALFALKIAGIIAALNLIALLIYRRGARAAG
jgi:amino acid transporter